MKKETPFALATTAALSLTGFTAAAPASANQPYEGTVTNCESSGVGSLPYVWNEVYPVAMIGNYTGRIDFAPDLDCDTIVLTESLMAEDTVMNIVGPGANNMTIVAPYYPRDSRFAFGVTNAGLKVSGLTFTVSDELRNSTEIATNVAPFLVQSGSGEIVVTDSVFRDVYTNESQTTIDMGLVYSEGNAYVNRVAFDNIEFGFAYGVGSHLIWAYGNAAVANSAFGGYVGNTFTEGTMVASISNDVYLLNNTFDFNIDGTDNDEFIRISQASSVTYAFGNLFVLDNKDYLDVLGTNSWSDQGYNIFAEGDNNLAPEAFDNIAGTSRRTTIAEAALETFANNGDDIISKAIGSTSLAKDFVPQSAYDSFVQGFIQTPQSDPTWSLALDQRGRNRLYGANIDAGSFEIQPTEVPSGLAKRKTVYFDSLSAKLTSKTKTALRRMLNSLGDDVTINKVVISGFVQPTTVTSNDKSLAKSRAKAVRNFLKASGVSAKVVLKAVGKAKEKNAKGRKVIVDVRYSETLR